MEFTENPAYGLGLELDAVDGAAPAPALAPVPAPRRRTHQHEDELYFGEEAADELSPLPASSKETGWNIEVWESNYDLKRQVHVEGRLSVGNLTARFVDMIGESFFLNHFFSFFTRLPPP